MLLGFQGATRRAHRSHTRTGARSDVGSGFPVPRPGNGASGQRSTVLSKDRLPQKKE